MKGEKKMTVEREIRKLVGEVIDRRIIEKKEGWSTGRPAGRALASEFHQAFEPPDKPEAFYGEASKVTAKAYKPPETVEERLKEEKPETRRDLITGEILFGKPERLYLIKGSIQKWTAIAFRGGTDQGRMNCPLCEQYNVGCYNTRHIDGTLTKGEECPVQKISGNIGCHGTPLVGWTKHQGAVHSEYGGSLKAQCPRCLQIAIAEIEFLCKVYRKEAEDELSRA
jgi:hypothetical protein